MPPDATEFVNHNIPYVFPADPKLPLKDRISAALFVSFIIDVVSAVIVPELVMLKPPPEETTSIVDPAP